MMDNIKSNKLSKSGYDVILSSSIPTSLIATNLNSNLETSIRSSKENCIKIDNHHRPGLHRISVAMITNKTVMPNIGLVDRVSNNSPRQKNINSSFKKEVIPPKSPSSPSSPSSKSNTTNYNYNNRDINTNTKNDNDNDTNNNKNSIIIINDDKDNKDSKDSKDNNQENVNNETDFVDSDVDLKQGGGYNYDSGASSGSEIFCGKNIGTGSSDRYIQSLPSDSEFKIIKESCMIIGKDLISHFGDLYDKYISSYNADYQINIHSQTRSLLQSLFDQTFYRRWKQHTHRRNVTPPPNELENIAIDVKLAEMIKIEDNKCDNMMMEQFSKYVDDELQRVKNTGVNNGQVYKNAVTIQNEMIEWLLSELMSNMEIAIREISRLMMDSFSRFQRNKKVYAKVVHLAIEFKNRQENENANANANGNVNAINVDGKQILAVQNK